MKQERIELVKYYIRHAGLGLPQAMKKVNTMSDEEVQNKREQIAMNTYH